MIQIITNTPLYVWPLLIYLIWGGFRSRKTYIVSWKTLLIMPAIMFVWSISTNFSSLWVFSISIGICLGFLTVRKLNLKFDKQQNLIEIAGNWIPLILSMSIFGLRYFLGATYGLHPELKGNSTLFLLENIATIVSGMFTGRLIAYWRRCKTSPHIELAANE